ncbi:MAG: hypothetical protein QOE01_2704 [Actinomycetota bacterium]|nr:hypothetical protein [Actinomycetota bacterium]
MLMVGVRRPRVPSGETCAARLVDGAARASTLEVVHVAVAAEHATSVHVEGPGGRRDYEIRLPADTRHAWLPMTEVTLCGLPVADLQQFPLVSFLPVPGPDACDRCLAVVATRAEPRVG